MLYTCHWNVVRKRFHGKPMIFGMPRCQRLSRRYERGHTGEGGVLGRPCCSVSAVTDGYVKVNNRFRRSSNRNRCCVAVVDFYVYSCFLEFLVLTRVPRVVTSSLSLSSPISHPSAAAAVVRQHIQTSIAGKPTKMSVNNVQALFACSRCFSRHPFEDLSPGQQLCKVRGQSSVSRGRHADSSVSDRRDGSVAIERIPRFLEIETTVQQSVTATAHSTRRRNSFLR